MVLAEENRMLRPICKACGRPEKFDFRVPNEIWRAVVPPPMLTRVICLHCFDDMAYRAGVDYSSSLKRLYFAGDQATFKFMPKRAVTGGSSPEPALPGTRYKTRRMLA